MVERGAGLGRMPVGLHAAYRSGGELVTDLRVLVGTDDLHARAGVGVPRPDSVGRSVSGDRAERRRIESDPGGGAGDSHAQLAKLVLTSESQRLVLDPVSTRRHVAPSTSLTV